MKGIGQHWSLLKIIISSIKNCLVTSNGAVDILKQKRCEKRLPLKYCSFWERHSSSLKLNLRDLSCRDREFKHLKAYNLYKDVFSSILSHLRRPIELKFFTGLLFCVDVEIPKWEDWSWQFIKVSSVFKYLYYWNYLFLKNHATSEKSSFSHCFIQTSALYCPLPSKFSGQQLFWVITNSVMGPSIG